MSNAIEQLRHWALNPPATIYDEECLTTLKLVARVAAKLNELIQAFKELNQGTVNALEEFENETIPAEVERQIMAHITNGDFDKAINLYAGNLTARLNLILQNSSTMKDAEVVDARMDHRGLMTGQGWPTVGDMLRFWLAEFENNMEAIITWQTEPVILNMILGYVNTSGQFTKEEMATHQCATLEVSPGERYRVKTSYGYSMPSFVVQDENHNPIMLGLTHDGGTAVCNYEQVITIPANAKYFIINSMNGYHCGLQRVVGVNSNALDGDYITNALSGIVSGPIIKRPLEGKILESHAIKNGEIFALENADVTHCVGMYPLPEGCAVHIKTAASFGCNPFMFRNKYGSVVGKLTVAPEDTYKEYDLTLRAPVGCAEICVYFTPGYETTVTVDSGCEVTPTGVQYSPNLSGVKCHVIGDSISEANSYAYKRWYQYIQDKTGISFTVDAVGGSGFVASPDKETSFLDRVADIPADSHVVVLFGSGNDLSALANDGYNPNEVFDFVRETIEEIHSTRPGIPVIVVTPSPWKGYASRPGEALSVDMLEYAAAIEDASQTMGVQCVSDLSTRCPFNPNRPAHIPIFFNRDSRGVHPNENGHKLMAPIIFDAIYKAVGTF